MRRLLRWLVVLCGYYCLVGLASAHELGRSRFAAPLPLPLLYLGAGGTVALTAGWLGMTDRVTTGRATRRLGSLSARFTTFLRVSGRIGFLLLFAAAIAHGVFGRQVAAENLATVFVWPVWLKGVGLLAILFGSPWRTLSPWESLYDLLTTLEGEELAVFGHPPAWLGSWPAVVGFVLGVGIVENLTVIVRNPSVTALLVAGYTLFMLFGAVSFGREWFARADLFAVLYRLFGRVAPVRFDRTDDGYRVLLRPPWAGCTDDVANTSLVVFVIATVYTVSFDGFANTPEYQQILFATRESLNAGSTVSVLMYVGGLLGFVVSYFLAILAVDALATGTTDEWVETARAFAPTVVPIAAAYEVAHNYPFVLQNIGQFMTIVRDLLVSSGPPITLLDWLSVPVFWGSQVVFIVGGHVIAVVAAHRVAVRRYEGLSLARRGHLPLIAVMIGYTVLSLWIISRPLVA